MLVLFRLLLVFPWEGGGVILYVVLFHNGSEADATQQLPQMNKMAFGSSENSFSFNNRAIWPKTVNYMLSFP